MQFVVNKHADQSQREFYQLPISIYKHCTKHCTNVILHWSYTE